MPVAEAWVDRLGLAGDGHNDRTVHGGPHRAVCLYSIEAIERLQADGHPVGPGSVGENLTTTGIEWSLLPVGTRARVGDQLLLEVASTAAPCATQRPNFSDGRFSRISLELFPSDARMYARVIQEGKVRPGDEVEVLAVAADSRAAEELILDRLDWIAAKSAVAEWRALSELGANIEIVDDGELVMAAVRDDPQSFHNHAYGLARLPNLIPDAQTFYDSAQTMGCLITDGPPWPDAHANPQMDVLAADPADLVEAATPPGTRITGAADNVEGWAEVRQALAAERSRTAGLDVGPEFARLLATSRHVAMLVASMDGRPVGTGWLYLGHRTGWLRGAAVVQSARRRGIHRALIAARARIAAEAGCDLVGSWAVTDSTSAHNLAAAGFRRVGRREHHRYVPAALAVPVP